MGLLNPTWLWGLAGLAIPVAIHLLSRKDMRVIRMGSLRHLEDSITRQSVRIHLNAYLLLLLRCAIVALVALLLAGLFFNQGKRNTNWVLVENGIEQEAHWRTVIDSLKAGGCEVRQLQPGFPLLSNDDDYQSSPDYWSLMEDLASVHPYRCVVISRNRFSGFAGYRPEHMSNVSWLTSANDSARFVLVSEKMAGDSVIARVGVSDENRTAFETIRLARAEAPTRLNAWSNSSSVPRPTEDEGAPAYSNAENEGDTASSTVNLSGQKIEPVRVILSGTTIDDEEHAVIMASLAAIQNNSIVPIQISTVAPNGPFQGDWLLWLSYDTPPSSSIPNLIYANPVSGTEKIAGAGTKPLIIRSFEPPAGKGRQPPTSPGTEGQQSPSGSGAAEGSGVPVSDSVILSSSTTAGIKGYRNRYEITAHLSPAVAVRRGFTLQLATLLLDDANSKLYGKANAFDHRTMPEAQMFSTPKASASETASEQGIHRQADHILAVVIVMLMAIERWVANRQQL